MQNFYFTFGSDGQPFRGGWIIISAHSRSEASEIFRKHWPDRENDVLNCAFVYTESEFMQTHMPKEGNLGAFCHRIISEIDFGQEKQHTKMRKAET